MFISIIVSINCDVASWLSTKSKPLPPPPIGLPLVSRISMFPSTSSRETLRFSGNKIHCFPRDKSLSDLLYSKANGSNRWKANNHVIDKWRATAVNISRVTVNCILFDVIVFAMLPAHGIWRETVSLLDVMWQWTSQWMGALQREKRQLSNNTMYLILVLGLCPLVTRTSGEFRLHS